MPDGVAPKVGVFIHFRAARTRRMALDSGQYNVHVGNGRVWSFLPSATDPRIARMGS
jgi:hypothetical protein